MDCTYHSHSDWSDGEATMSQMIRGAEKAGVVEYGLSDHFVLRPDGKREDWSMDLDKLDDYVAAVQSEARQASIPVRLGLEVDFFPGMTDILRERISGHPFDYVIGSIHFSDDFPVDATAADWEPLSQDEINDVYRRYWGIVAELAESRLYDFAGHLDLPKKFGFFPSVDLSWEMDSALDAIAANDLAVELNTAGWDKVCGEGYPSETILRGCHQREIPVLINDDSHHPSHIGRHFQRAGELLHRIGYREVVRFAGRERTAVPLAV